ncbi:predicted protein [Thalassiosira pseudonana CCMP1335]|uniref:Uncharacterized protein n=1 Tax=Thalassiosira pseudonana TaxID=35128 RepID=B5YNW4_THAPS|nr:predicted protein [Thalassiosira pseudonana CCMP1335]ACI65055.1 predicted protein [Thalassiosira pseudonana CCMP1335]
MRAIVLPALLSSLAAAASSSVTSIDELGDNLEVVSSTPFDRFGYADDEVESEVHYEAIDNPRNLFDEIVNHDAPRNNHNTPTVSSNLRTRQTLSCPSTTQSILLQILTDNYPDDTSWTLQKDNGVTIASSPTNYYQKNTLYNHKYCLDIGREYTLRMEDEWGDGIQKQNGNGGYYSISVERTNGALKKIFTGGRFKKESVDVFAVNANGGSNGGQTLTFSSRMGCPSSKRKAKVDIQLDMYGSETTWKLQGEDGVEYMRNSRVYGASDFESVEKCLPEQKYNLIVFDKVGDGICCQQGQGYYTFSIENEGSYEKLLKGGNFKTTKIVHSIKVVGSTFMSNRDEEWLVAHNTRRKKYHQQYGKKYVPLKWSEGLKQSSAQYAEELLSSCPSPTIIHDPNNAYGENLAKNKGTGGWGDLKPAENVTRSLTKHTALPFTAFSGGQQILPRAAFEEIAAV